MELRKLRLKEFEDGINRFSLRLEKLQKKSRRIGYYRLFVFVLGLFLFLFSFFYLTQLFVWISLGISVIAFGMITAIFNKIDLGIKKNRLWINIKKDNLARMKIDWPDIPLRDFPEMESDHPFESDLSITGKNSLHQLIDISTSAE